MSVFVRFIAICHSKQNTWIIKIKYGDHNHLPIFIRAHTTHKKLVMIDDIKLKIVIWTQVDTSTWQNLFVYLLTRYR